MGPNFKWKYAVFTLILICLPSSFCDISVSTHDLSLKLDDNINATLEIRNISISEPVVLEFIVQHEDIVKVEPKSLIINNSEDVDEIITIYATGAGNSDVYANISNTSINVEDVFFRVTVSKVPELDTFSLVIGWIYFVAWSISFYPQIYINWKRKRYHYCFRTLLLSWSIKIYK